MSQNWIGHALERTNLSPRRQVTALASLGLLVAIILGGLYLSQAAATSTLGRELEEMIAQRNRLEQANEQLRAEIASLQSVPRLLTRAQELGFESAGRESIEYIMVDGYNPRRSEIVLAVEAEAEAPLPTYDETFGGWLQEQFATFTRQFERYTDESQNAPDSVPEQNP